MFGPVLVKQVVRRRRRRRALDAHCLTSGCRQDLDEAKGNTAKRMAFMQGQLASIDKELNTKRDEQNKSKQKVQQIQELFTNAQNELRARAAAQASSAQ